LQGDLVPKFQPDVHVRGEPDTTGFFSIFNQHAAAGFASYAKLTFWCFAARYSERFVADVIGKFDGNTVKTINK